MSRPGFLTLRFLCAECGWTEVRRMTMGAAIRHVQGIEPFMCRACGAESTVTNRVHAPVDPRQLHLFTARETPRRGL